jgi:hypothetical protein
MTFLVFSKKGSVSQSDSLSDEQVARLIAADNCVVVEIVTSGRYFNVHNLLEDGTREEIPEC